MDLTKLKNKFLMQFEPPAVKEEYDTHEGGYQNSTLLDTEDAIAEVFSDLPDDVYKDLIKLLNQYSVQWARK